jgi:hypothetical protein
MIIIETPIFTRIITASMSDDEYRELQEALVIRPNSGDLIKKSGGLRKVRWKLQGRGKSGGIRVIYYWMVSNEQIYMLYAYPKGKQENLTPQQLATLKSIVERWSDE